MKKNIVYQVFTHAQKKNNAIILLDYDYTTLNLCGFKNDYSDVVALDKERGILIPKI
jgi:hypothetical protein